MKRVLILVMLLALAIPVIGTAKTFKIIFKDGSTTYFESYRIVGDMIYIQSYGGEVGYHESDIESIVEVEEAPDSRIIHGSDSEPEVYDEPGALYSEYSINFSTGEVVSCGSDLDTGIREIIDTGQGFIFLNSSGELYVSFLFWFEFSYSMKLDIAKAFALYTYCHDYPGHDIPRIRIYEQLTDELLATWSVGSGLQEYY
jgi:hypothetical protein